MLDTIVDEVFENECQLNLCTLRAQEKVGMLFRILQPGKIVKR